MSTTNEWPEETPPRPAWLRWLPYTLGLLLLVGLAIYFARPAVQAIRGWQARRIAQEAAGLMAGGRDQEALMLALAAARLRWAEPAPRRLAARAAEKLGEASSSFRLWEQLRTDGFALEADEHASYARAAASIGRLETAATQLAALGPASSGESSGRVLARAMVARRQSQLAEAIGFGRRVVEDPRATGQEGFQAALLLADIATGLDWEAAVRTMRHLAGEPTPLGRDALVWLATSPRMQLDPGRPTSQELLLALRTHRELSSRHELLLFELEMQAEPAQSSAILRRAVARFGSGQSPSELGMLTHWLNGRGSEELVLLLLPERTARTSPELLDARLAALAGRERWADLLRELRGVGAEDLTPLRREILFALAYTRMGDKNAAEPYWRRARTAASEQTGLLLQLARTAEKCGATPAAEAAYRRAADLDPIARPVQEAYLQFLGRQANAPRLRERVQSLRRLWPKDDALCAMEVYLAALTNAIGPSITADAERLARVQGRGDRLSGPALVLVRRGESARALALLPVADDDQHALVVRLVRAAALRGAGFTVEARQTAGRLTRQDFQFPEEQALLDEIAQGL